MRTGCGCSSIAAQVHGPREARGVIDNQLVGGAARRETQRDGAEERRQIGGCTLLVEGLCLGTIDEALEDDGPVADAVERARRDGQKVADEIELGELDGAREVELCRMGDADLVSIDDEDLDVFGFGGLRHGDRVYQPVVQRRAWERCPVVMNWTTKVLSLAIVPVLWWSSS